MQAQLAQSLQLTVTPMCTHTLSLTHKYARLFTHSLCVLPGWAEGVLSTLSQMQRGDVVIVPDLSLVDYKDVVAYPTPEFVQLWSVHTKTERQT
jgi:hypothetical protein